MDDNSASANETPFPKGYIAAEDCSWGYDAVISNAAVVIDLRPGVKEHIRTEHNAHADDNADEGL